jgi:hypothetical protein
MDTHTHDALPALIDCFTPNTLVLDDLPLIDLRSVYAALGMESVERIGEGLVRSGWLRPDELSAWEAAIRAGRCYRRPGLDLRSMDELVREAELRTRFIKERHDRC